MKILIGFVALAISCLLTPTLLESQTVKSTSAVAKEKVWAGKDKGILGYRVIRKAGHKFEVESIVEKAPFYHFVDRDGKKSWNLIDSVERIEPIPDPNFASEKPVTVTYEESAQTGSSSAISSPRNTANSHRLDETPPVVSSQASASDGASLPSAKSGVSHDSASSDSASSRIEPRTYARSVPRTKARTNARQAYRATPPYSDFVDQSQSNIGTTATGIPLQMGPRGGVFHYSASGNKVYERKR